MAYLTYFDLVESLITSSYGGPQDAEQRDIRTAIHRAYNELTTIRDWSYYHVHGRVITSAPYSTGTVVSSGATATLTGGTWPAWAGTGAYLKIGDEICRVASRTSDTVVVLDPTLSLKASVTGAPYTLYRTVYPLPSDFRNMDEPSDEYNWWSGMYLTPDEAMKVERVNNSSGEPYHWTVIKDPDSTGWAIKLIGYPSQVETIDFTYRRTARPIRWSGHETGVRISSASVNEDSVATWSAPNPAVPFNAAGSIFRLGDGSTYPGPIESMTPYVAEAKITAVQGSRQVLAAGLAGDPPTTYSATAAIITDPIDIPAHMYGVMDSACDYFLARIRGQKADAAFAMYQRDLRLAMEMDQLAPLSGRSSQVWHDGGWRSPLKVDRG
jgi:hypothetical protein